MKMFRNFTLAFLFMMALTAAVAQPPGGGGEGGFEDPDAAIPIDGGISILAAAGVAYGITALRKKKIASE